jgi:hypothetical protein
VWIDGALMNISKVISGQPIAKVEYLTTTKTLIEKIEEHEGTFTCYDILLESGNCISVAECHYFMTESQRWISVQDLKKGIRLKTANGEIMIKKIIKRPTAYIGTVFNLKIDGSNFYLVGRDAIVVRDF